MTDGSERSSDATEQADERWPIGFMLFVGLAGLYLVVRLVQMAGWVLDRLF